MTPEQATDLFIQLTKQAGYVNADELDRDAILQHFREIFAR